MGRENTTEFRTKSGIEIHDFSDITWKRMSGMKELTRRGVLYVGFLCDINCRICYYRYMPKEQRPWKDIRNLKALCNKFRFYYRNHEVDITGGEPTIYPKIFELLKYCSLIDLKPSIITHGQNLSPKRSKQFQEAGINDFLVSVHGLEKSHDYITNTKNGFNKVMGSLDNLNDIGVPFRINTVLTKYSCNDLPKLAELFKTKDAKQVNFISFNPFSEWCSKPQIEFQAKHSDFTKPLSKAIDILEEDNIKVNVRYFPFCMLPGHEKNISGFCQVPYDLKEWDYASMHGFIIDQVRRFRSLDEFYYKTARRTILRLSKENKKCRKCSAEFICDMLFYQYHNRFGDDELKPINPIDEKIANPLYFKLNKYTLENQQEIVKKIKKKEELSEKEKKARNEIVERPRLYGLNKHNQKEKTK